jgi:para-nitrobenzyl esterase
VRACRINAVIGLVGITLALGCIMVFGQKAMADTDLPWQVYSPNKLNSLVMTDAGWVQGVNEGDINHFYGIPYAEAPVGDLRWQAPQDVTPWEGVLTADTFGASPIQYPGLADMLGITEQSEDCLNLNVWAPEGDVSDLPVLVWISGGAFQFGSGSMPHYDGSALAAQGAVVVTINYRLGPLGYLVHPDMALEQEYSGNYGQLDQLAALEWVNQNIEAFGGSTDKITIFGQSAGGSSTWMNMYSPMGEGLFDRVISQSGTGPGNQFALHGFTGSWQEAAAMGQYLGEYLGASSLEEMRELPAELLVNAAAELGLYFGPVVDGQYLTDDFRNLAGTANDVPLLIGSTANDAMGWDEPPTSVEKYQAYLAATFGEDAALVEQMYPATNSAEAWGLFDFVGTTASMTEPVRFTARATQAQGLDTYRYMIEYAPNTERGQLWGAHHDVEIPYVFGNMEFDEGYDYYDYALSKALMNYWISFADSGDPNVAGQSYWPTYGSQENILNVGTTLSVIRGYYNQDCDFFESIAPRTLPDYPVW